MNLNLGKQKYSKIQITSFSQVANLDHFSYNKFIVADTQVFSKQYVFLYQDDLYFYYDGNIYKTKEI